MIEYLDTEEEDIGEEVDLPDIVEVPYYEEIVNTLYSSFFKTASEVLRNKFGDNLDTEITMSYQRSPDDVVDFSRSPNTCLKVCINTDKVFNIRTDIVECRENWSVINSTATDIEILRAVVNVLTTIITSNQFLSVTRRYDPKVTNEKTIERHLSEDRRYMKNKIHAIMEAISEDENYDLIQGLIGGVVISGDNESFGQPDPFSY